MILTVLVTFCLVVALAFGLMAAWSDVTKLIIPNIYSLLIIGAFVLAYGLVWFFAPDSSYFQSWHSHLIAFGMMFAITYGLFFFKFIGGGDSKLLSAYALWTGLSGLMSMLFIMALVGGILGAVTLYLNKNKFFSNPATGGWIATAQEGGKDLPYGLAIVIGALLSFWYTGLIQPQELMILVSGTTE